MCVDCTQFEITYAAAMVKAMCGYCWLKKVSAGRAGAAKNARSFSLVVFIVSSEYSLSTKVVFLILLVYLNCRFAVLRDMNWTVFDSQCFEWEMSLASLDVVAG